MTVASTGHLPPDTATTIAQGASALAGTPASKQFPQQLGSPVSQMSEATTPGRSGQQQVKNSLIFFVYINTIFEFSESL